MIVKYLYTLYNPKWSHCFSILITIQIHGGNYETQRTKEYYFLYRGWPGIDWFHRLFCGGHGCDRSLAGSGWLCRTGRGNMLENL